MKAKINGKTYTDNDFNGYDFNEPKTRKRMKYVIVTDGDLDHNGAYAFSSKRALKLYLKSEYNRKGLQAIFEVKDATKLFNQ